MSAHAYAEHTIAAAIIVPLPCLGMRDKGIEPTIKPRCFHLSSLLAQKSQRRMKKIRLIVLYHISSNFFCLLCCIRQRNPSIRTLFATSGARERTFAPASSFFNFLSLCSFLATQQMTNCSGSLFAKLGAKSVSLIKGNAPKNIDMIENIFQIIFSARSLHKPLRQTFVICIERIIIREIENTCPMDFLWSIKLSDKIRANIWKFYRVRAPSFSWQQS